MNQPSLSTNERRLPALAVTLFFVAAVVIGFIYLREKLPLPTEQPQFSIPDIQTVSLFSRTLAENGISATDIGLHSFSPDGKYFLFITFKEGKVPGNETHLLDLKTGTIKTLPGIPERGFTDSRIIQLFDTEGNTILFFPETSISKKYAVDEGTYAGFLSPNSTRYAINTAHGIKLIDPASDEIKPLSSGQNDGAYAWFSDNKRMLGFKETEEELLDAGKGRMLGVLDTDTGNFEPITITFSQKTLRWVEWLKQDKVARVNAGFDDGSYDYIVDITKGTVVEIGETSGALMGGMTTDQTLGLFAVVKPGFESSQGEAMLYDDTLKQLHKVALPGDYLRESVRIVNKNTLLYIRKTLDTSSGYKITKNELVKLDLQKGEEIVMRELPNTYSQVSLAPDHKTWVVSAKDTFFSGLLE